ncbi:hypothetical protein SDC9_164539 [bioreactor metagenome]|uniref:Uncharacterized protein n=1 Tax=bioreactor metagenome TaxID=1076179 RepID=A0A645FUJ9_9ZZZZ
MLQLGMFVIYQHKSDILCDYVTDRLTMLAYNQKEVN